jgi:hypothetical protein
VDWISEQQNYERTQFFELNILSEDLQDLIVFSRNLLRGWSSSIISLLNLIKASTPLLPIFVVDILSETDNRKEILFFVGEVLEDSTTAFEFGRSRILGPLLRVFPFILDQFLVQILELIRESFATS